MTDIYEQAAEALAGAPDGPWRVDEDNDIVDARGHTIACTMNFTDPVSHFIALSPAMAEELARVKAKMEAAEELAKEASEAVCFLVENGIAAQSLAKSIMAFRAAGETADDR